jgi:hypothetical protein
VVAPAWRPHTFDTVHAHAPYQMAYRKSLPAFMIIINGSYRLALTLNTWCIEGVLS